MIRITKVKLTKEKKINIEYQVVGKKGIWDESSFTCQDEALPEMYTAVKNLGVHVIGLCELPPEYYDRVTVKGVSASYTTDGVMGAVIISSMQLFHSNCPLNLNTPYKPAEEYGDQPAPADTLLTPMCVADIKALFNECIKYIAGYRAQTDLFMAVQPELVATEIMSAEISKIFDAVDLGNKNEPR